MSDNYYNQNFDDSQRAQFQATSNEDQTPDGYYAPSGQQYNSNTENGHIPQNSIGDDFPPPKPRKDSIKRVADPIIEEEYKSSNREPLIKKAKKVSFNFTIPWHIKNKFERCCPYFLCFILSALYIGTFIFMIFYLIAYYTNPLSISDVSGGLQAVAKNLNYQPVLDIKLQTSSNCPSGYSFNRVGYWDGTGSGCICGRYSIDRGFCDEDSACFNQSGTPSEAIPRWKRKSFCYKRADPDSDFSYKPSCNNSTEIECSPGICFKKSIGCPITGAYTTKTSINDDSQKIESGVYLNLDKNISGELPLVVFSAQFSKLPCFDSGRRYIGSDNYPLVYEGSCGKYKYFTNYSESIDNYTQLNLLTDNRIDPNAEYFDDYAEDVDAYLSYRQRIDVKPTSICQNLDIDAISHAGDNINEIDNATIIGGWFAVFLALFSAISGIIMLINYFNDDFKCPQIFHGLISFLFFVDGLVIYLVVRSHSRDLVNFQQTAQDVQSQKCFINTAQTVFDDFNLVDSNQIPNILGYTRSLMALSASEFGVFILFALFVNTRLCRS